MGQELGEQEKVHIRGCVQLLGENVLEDTKWKVRDKAKYAAGRPWEGGDRMRCPGSSGSSGRCLHHSEGPALAQEALFAFGSKRVWGNGLSVQRPLLKGWEGIVLGFSLRHALARGLSTGRTAVWIPVGEPFLHLAF